MQKISIQNYIKNYQQVDRSSRGFSLLETLVGVFIFSISLISLTTIASRGIQATQTAIARSTAQFLAQEGIEAVELIRDNNFLNPNPLTEWNKGLECSTGCVTSGYLPYMWGQSDSFPSLSECTSSGCEQMQQIKEEGRGEYYGYGSGNDSRPSLFTRTIIIQEAPSSTQDTGGDEITPDQMLVTSRVTWERNGVERSVETYKYLTNWYQATIDESVGEDG